MAYAARLCAALALTQAAAACTPAPPPAVRADEIESIRGKIRPCWPARKLASAPIVGITVQMNRDGSIAKAEIRDRARYEADADFRQVADDAWRALMNPRCQPWPLPPEKYDAWRTMTFYFDPRDY
jgi:hypothetical protein